MQEEVLGVGVSVRRIRRMLEADLAVGGSAVVPGVLRVSRAVVTCRRRC